MRCLVALTAIALCCAGPLAADEPQEFSRRELDFFETKIRPVLVKHCYKCHSEKSDDLGANLRVDLREGLLRGGDSGPAVVPKDPQSGTLLSALEYKDFEMPPEGKLPDEVIADFRRWIRRGAADPRDGKMSADNSNTAVPAQEIAGDLWSLRPIVPGAPPENDGRTPIDRFLVRKLNENGLAPVPPAGALTLLRRISFDLTGLPPSLERQRTFEEAYKQNSQQAVADLVDELLASERYGERWGRHWLDVVRYAESTGNSRDVLSPFAWRYRNYVIDAFNADVPFDRFIQEQIAGDLLPADGAAERDRLRIATGMLAIGSKSLNGGNLKLDIIDDQIDVVGKAILGLTVSCARCHDHKFDPIPTKDYYALAGIFGSTETFYGGSTKRPKNDAEQAKLLLVLGDDPQKQLAVVNEHQKRLAELNKRQKTAAKLVAQLEKRLPKDWKKQFAVLKRRAEAGDPSAQNEEKEGDAQPLNEKEKKLLAQMVKLDEASNELESVKAELADVKASELPDMKFAMGVQESKKIGDEKIHIRGEKNKTGDTAPRGFLSCVAMDAVPKITDQQSGRLELARWLTDPHHPLTPRVAVNRVWQHLFGRGLVETVDNFGVNGTPPSHPALLDYLADRFVRVHRWSTKKLIREIVLSDAYRRSSSYDAHDYSRDPDNAFLWRMSRRRLEAEALRDALLAASGNLDVARPHASLVAQVGEGEVGRGINTKILVQPFPHRSVYLPIVRGIVPEMLKLFDLPEPSNPQGQRDTTNVPAQALFLMNSPFVIEQADGLARRLLKEDEGEYARITLAFRICFARDPQQSELDRANQFLSSVRDEADMGQSPAERELAAWSALAQALFASAEFRFID